MKMIQQFGRLLPAIALAAATLATAQSSKPGRPAVPQITQAIDEHQLLKLPDGRPPLAAASADRGVAPDNLQLGRTILVLKPSAERQAALAKFLAEQQNPHSASYRHWLTPQQFGEQFGAAPEDIQKVNTWLQSHGFTVEEPVAGRNLVVFSGTQAQLKAAFHTELHSFQVEGKSYLANATAPSIPAALAPVVAGFASLNNFPRKPMHKPMQIVRRDGREWKNVNSKAAPKYTFTQNGTQYYGIGPADLATIYNFQPLWDAGIDGTGQTIAIVSDSDINPADVDTFRSIFGLPEKKLNITYYGGNPGRGDHEGEADLDVQWAGAVAKNATIDLVVSPNTSTSGGIESAAIYIINNNLAPLMSVSYGLCELAIGTAGNQFFNEIWQQAAAQGITVLVATGDEGSASCDAGNTYALNGLSVNALASTPYNVAVGGTDLYGTAVDESKYWNSTNDSNTLASALSYIPETTWNDSCASPQVLAALQANGYTATTNDQLCNDYQMMQYFLTTTSGSGGPSNCAVVADDQTTCLQGYAKPAWQTGVPGIPSDGVRDLPDVSLMSGDGLWGTFYVMCQSDALPTGTCDVNDNIQGGGGTSFATPVFAGMLALLEQKTSNRQGNINYNLYKLAATQFSGDNSACVSGSVTSGNACKFYDVNEGTIAVPCFGGTKDCTTADPSYGFGILPGYATAAGYDLATGIGSVNANNLVLGWDSSSGTYAESTTTLTASGSATAPYGSSIEVQAAVAAAGSGTGTPTGDVGIISDSTIVNNKAAGSGTLVNGVTTIQAELMQGGTYNLIAHYAGDATFAPSDSAGLPITITPVPMSGATAASTRTTITSGQKASLTLSVPGIEYGESPTGAVTFTDSTSGQVLGTASLIASPTTDSVPSSTALLSITASQLQAGTNQVQVSYAGDRNYAPLAITGPAITLSSSFTALAAPGSVTFAPNGTGTATITVSPTNGGTLNPASFNFACPASLTAFTCSFGAPTAAAGGAVQSTLTLQFHQPAAAPAVRRAENRPNQIGRGWMIPEVALGVGLWGCFLARRRRVLKVLGTLPLLLIFVLQGCGSGSSSKPTQPVGTTTTLAASPASAAWGTQVTLTAHVAAASGSQTPGGSVTFTSGSTTLGTATLSSGAASITTSTLPVGTQSIVAAYGGVSGFNTSTSAAASVQVSYASTITVTAQDTTGNTATADLQVTVQ